MGQHGVPDDVWNPASARNQEMPMGGGLRLQVVPDTIYGFGNILQNQGAGIG